MTLAIKVGSNKDLPPKPENWPTCGSFSFNKLATRVGDEYQAEQNFSNIFKHDKLLIELLYLFIFIYHF